MIGPTGANLVFLLGIPRSGTTLLGRLLANHPALSVPPEPWVMLALHGLRDVPPAHPADAGLVRRALDAFLDDDAWQHVTRICAVSAYNRHLQGSKATVLVDKTPRYHLILPFLAGLLPDARFIWIRRDPFDVVASFRSSWEIDLPRLIGSDPSHRTVIDLVIGLARLEAFTREHERVHEIAYEDLVVAPEATIEACIVALGLDPAGDLAHLDTAPTRASPSMGDEKILATNAVHARSVGTGLDALAPDALQVVHDALGRPLVARVAGPGVIEGLAARGVVDRGPEVTRGMVDRVEAALTARWDDVASPGRFETQRYGKATLTGRIVQLERDRLVAEHRRRKAEAALRAVNPDGARPADPSPIRSLVARAARLVRTGDGPADTAAPAPATIDRLRDLMRRYQTKDLVGIDESSFRARLDAFRGLRDHAMEGYSDDASQRDMSVQFHWGHDHDFGPFRLDGLMGERHLQLPALFMDGLAALPPSLEGQRVLDIGCWTGGMSLLMCAMGASVVAIEEVRKYVDCLRFLADSFGVSDRLDARHLSLYELGADEYQDAFDLVMFAGVIYHVTDPVLALRHVFNTLRDGGTCLVETLYHDRPSTEVDYWGPTRFGVGGSADEKSRAGWNWFVPSPKALARMMEDVGFREVRHLCAAGQRLLASGRRTGHVDLLRAGLSVPRVR